MYNEEPLEDTMVEEDANLAPEESGVLNIDMDNIHFSEANFRITSP